MSLVPDDSPAWPPALGQAAAIGSEIESVQRQIRQLTELLAELRRRRQARAQAAGGADTGFDAVTSRMLWDRSAP